MNWGDCLFNGDVATFNCVNLLLQNVVNFLTVFAGIVAAFFIVMAGVQFIRSEGDKTRIENARKTLTYTIVGLIIIVFSYFLLSILTSLFGAKGIFQ